MFTSEIKGSGQQAKEAVEDDVRHMKSDLRGAAGTVKEDLHNVARHTGEHARQVMEATQDTFIGKVRDNPVQSTLIALGAGFMLGVLFRR